MQYPCKSESKENKFYRFVEKLNSFYARFGSVKVHIMSKQIPRSVVQKSMQLWSMVCDVCFVNVFLHSSLLTFTMLISMQHFYF